MAEIDPRICALTGEWYRSHARDLPWRAAERTPWGVLVSEVMLQQTPVSRVIPSWVAWIDRWPNPTALAEADASEVIRMWGTLGYPRRALRLQSAAAVMVRDHDGKVPATLDDLLALPGIGAYTARAVLAFAFGQRHPVIDVNVARVIARCVDGTSHPPTTVGRTALERLERALPLMADEAVGVSAALMELGATVCTARSPDCRGCVLNSRCSWVASGNPEAAAPERRSQPWIGTDRHCRGTIMAALRSAAVPLVAEQVDLLWPDAIQRERCVASLVTDGLAHQHESSRHLSLP